MTSTKPGVDLAATCLAAVVVALVFVAASPAALQVAPVSVEPPTITGTAKVGETLTGAGRHLGQQPDKLPLPLASL